MAAAEHDCLLQPSPNKLCMPNNNQYLLAVFGGNG